jgi:hypothetical protein
VKVTIFPIAPCSIQELTSRIADGKSVPAIGAPKSRKRVISDRSILTSRLTALSESFSKPVLRIDCKEEFQPEPIKNERLREKSECVFPSIVTVL